MIKKLVKHEVDPARPTPLTAEQQVEITALHALPDGEIDTSDIPPLTDTFWKGAVSNPFYNCDKLARRFRRSGLTEVCGQRVSDTP